MDTRGYARLNASLLMSAVLLVAVIGYQSFAHRQLANGGGGDPLLAVYTGVQLFPQSIPSLSRGLYELFVTDVAGNTHFVSRFSVNDSRQVLDSNGSLVPNALFLLPPNVSQVAAASVKITDGAAGRDIDFLSGATRSERVVLAFDGMDLNNARGSYMLGTPTDGNDTINERSGVWFGDFRSGATALALPALKAGWVYEGWAVIGDRPLTTGRFTTPTASDLFSGFSDTQSSTPRLPGEDFLFDPPVAVFPGLAFPLDLADQLVRISLEPDMAGIDPTGQSPLLGMTLLEAEVGRRAEPHRLFEMELLSDDLPQGILVLR